MIFQTLKILKSIWKNVLPKSNSNYNSPKGVCNRVLKNNFKSAKGGQNNVQEVS